MAKTRTARELAKQAAEGPGVAKAQVDVLRLLESVGLLLLLVAAAAMFYQAWLSILRGSQQDALQQAATRVQQVVQEEVGKIVGLVEKVAVDPATVTLFAQGRDMDLVAARNSLRAPLGQPQDVDLLVGGDVLATLGAELANFGYAKSDMLLQAQSSKGLAAAQMLLEQNNSRSLAVSAAVLSQTEILGYLLARYDSARILQAVADWKGAGRIELRQGTGDGLLIAATAESFFMERGAPTLPVPRSALRVVYAMPPEFFSLGLGTLGAFAVGLLLLGGAATLFWVRVLPRLPARSAAKTAADPSVPPVRVDIALETDRTPAALPEPIVVPEAAASTSSGPARRADSRSSGDVAAAKVDRSIFRAYDIRGVIDQTLNPAVAHQIGRAIGSEVRARNLREVVVARDGRLSGPALLAGLIDGLRASGCDVIDVGMVPTPVLYFATYELRAHSGVMVTGSHNPPDYNGFKIVIGGETLSDQAIQDLYGRIAEQRFSSGSGSVQSIDVLDAYVERISSDIQLETPLRIVADCGNGVAGVIAEKLLASIGCEVEPLYTEVDGLFPNHHPDPSEPKNLRDLILTVKQIKADVGVAFDGDGDRLGVVTPKGKILNPDRLLMLFAKDVLVRNPGATVIYDVKCTGHLTNVIRGAGGVPIMWRTGHSLIKGKMRETQAELAGEMSGHFFFKERWFGFDDGLYAACRLLEIVAASGLDIDELFDELPDSVSTPELKVPMVEGEHYRFIEKFKEKARFDGARINNIDGVRADWDDGWGLVRCSNTTPVLVLRFDASDEAALLRIQDVFRQQLLAIGPKLQLPF